MRKPTFEQKIFADYMPAFNYLCKVLKSCNTKAQVLTFLTWSCHLFSQWRTFQIGKTKRKYRIKHIENAIRMYEADLMGKVDEQLKSKI